MNGFASIVLFMVLISHSTGVMIVEVKKISDLPVRLYHSALLHENFAEPFWQVPGEVLSDGLTKLESETGRTLEREGLYQCTPRKYSVLFDGEDNRRHVVIAPIGNPPQAWGMLKKTDENSSTNTWWILYADLSVTQNLQYRVNEDWF